MPSNGRELPHSTPAHGSRIMPRNLGGAGGGLEQDVNGVGRAADALWTCLLYTSPSPRDAHES
eukprot:693983-Prymnesium_polylepis.1